MCVCMYVCAYIYIYKSDLTPLGYTTYYLHLDTVKLFHYDKKQFFGNFQHEYLNIMLTLILYPGHKLFFSVVL
jgi:hypothetical protein